MPFGRAAAPDVRSVDGGPARFGTDGPDYLRGGHTAPGCLGGHPADLRKDAGAFDLPIALGLLVATGQLLPEQLRDHATVGELALDGSVRPVKEALSMAMAAAARGIPKMLVPAANARAAAVVKEVAPVLRLTDVHWG